MDLEEIKLKVQKWSGFKLHGENYEELQNNLRGIKQSMEDEIHSYTEEFRIELDKFFNKQ